MPRRAASQERVRLWDSGVLRQHSSPRRPYTCHNNTNHLPRTYTTTSISTFYLPASWRKLAAVVRKKTNRLDIFCNDGNPRQDQSTEDVPHGTSQGQLSGYSLGWLL
ncbi:hypothetical protein E2C01_054307 [Portunus trituberculatus]|uniref:Uncharacterized protein n=1 Tax=Portunus trituberculatus TaxID=210409 RepID=A0A5B7GTD6_PORTR|nr:hypothetical protein [Portunus trituberculatus]